MLTAFLRKICGNGHFAQLCSSRELPSTVYGTHSTDDSDRVPIRVHVVHTSDPQHALSLIL